MNDRFTYNDKIVTDNITGLMWARNANIPGPLSWKDATDYVNFLDLGGYNDCWRLPTVNEINSLVDRLNCDPALPSEHPFLNVQSFNYWSSTKYAGSVLCAWVVNMWSGSMVANSKTYDCYVWPVRGRKQI